MKTEFKPNLTPYQIFKNGSFGGTYWRPIYSRITKKKYKNVHKQYKFLQGIDEKYLSQSKCDHTINKYKVNSGSSLEEWENKIGSQKIIRMDGCIGTAIIIVEKEVKTMSIK